MNFVRMCARYARPAYSVSDLISEAGSDAASLERYLNVVENERSQLLDLSSSNRA